MKDKLKLNINFEGIRDNIINFIIPLIALVGSVGLFLLIIYPAINEIPILKTDLEASELLKNTLRTKHENLTRLVDFKAAVDENSGLVDRVLPSETKVPELLNQVDNIARSSGLLVSRLNYTFSGAGGQDTIAADKSYEFVVVSLGADGTYEQMITFFENMEKAARIVDLSNFRLSVDNSNNNGVYGFNFTVYAPYLYVQSNAVTDEPVDLDVTSQKFTDLINRLKSLQFYDNVVTLEEPVPEEVSVAEDTTVSTDETVSDTTIDTEATTQ